MTVAKEIELKDPLENMDFSNAILTEQRAEELQERYPGVAEMSMGAEAALSVLARLELGGLSESLHVEVATTSGQRRKKAMKRLLDAATSASGKARARPRISARSTSCRVTNKPSK
mgnify:CR=1 FL=1